MMKCFLGDESASRFQGQPSTRIAAVYLLQPELEATASTCGCHASLAQVVVSFLITQTVNKANFLTLCTFSSQGQGSSYQHVPRSGSLVYRHSSSPSHWTQHTLFLFQAKVLQMCKKLGKGEVCGSVIVSDLSKITPRWLHFSTPLFPFSSSLNSKGGTPTPLALLFLAPTEQFVHPWLWGQVSGSYRAAPIARALSKVLHQ